MTIWQQMQSGLVQLPQLPVTAQGGLDVEALSVGGSRHLAGPGNGTVQITHDLVHPGDDQDTLRPEAQGRYPVGVAVQVHQLAVGGDGVAAHDKGAAGQGLPHQRLLFFGGLAGVPVDELIVTLVQAVHEPDLGGGDGATPGYGAVLGDQGQGQVQGLLGSGHIVGLKMAAAQGLGHLGSGLVVAGLDGSFHDSFSFLGPLLKPLGLVGQGQRVNEGGPGRR